MDWREETINECRDVEYGLSFGDLFAKDISDYKGTPLQKYVTRQNFLMRNQLSDMCKHSVIKWKQFIESFLRKYHDRELL